MKFGECHNSASAPRLACARHAGPDAHTAVPADVLRRYKETACPTSSASEQCQQSSLTEQHAWKLVAALFCPQLDDEPTRAVDGHATASSALGARDGGAAAAMRAEREREAMRAWLRDALWDGAPSCAAAEADGDLDGGGLGSTAAPLGTCVKSPFRPGRAAMPLR